MHHLVIDLGNTKAKLGIYKDSVLTDFQSVEHTALPDLLEKLAHNNAFQRSIISSVIQEESSWKSILKAEGPLIELDHTTALPIVNNYQTPETLGRDRLALAVAAWQQFPGENVLAIDAGTSITYELVTADAVYQGGAIAPGLHMRAQALHTFTQKLPFIPPREEVTPLGTTTESAILAGVVAAARAEMRGMIQYFQNQYAGLKVMLTGGDLNFFVNHLENHIFAHPHSVLEGLHAILVYHVQQQLV